jgi:hypothetical protein
MMEQVLESPSQATIYQLSSYNWVLTVGRLIEALSALPYLSGGLGGNSSQYQTHNSLHCGYTME